MTIDPIGLVREIAYLCGGTHDIYEYRDEHRITIVVSTMTPMHPDLREAMEMAVERYAPPNLTITLEFRVVQPA